MKAISVRESQVYLLRIAKWFDSICKSHNIPYYMLGGTMLGAIRHHGFIPWDDDMDFGVPIEYYEQLRKLLKDNVTDHIRVCEFQKCKGCRTAFIKIDDTRTCIDDKCVDLPIEEKLGVNIDIFPLVTCKKKDFTVFRHLFLTKLNSVVFVEPISGSQSRHYIKKALRFSVPFNQDALLRHLWKLTLSIHEGDCYGNLFGRYRSKEIISKKIFGKVTSYQFEDTTFWGPEDYHGYLSLLYNDYMQLPPEDQRSNHSSGLFKRDN